MIKVTCPTIGASGETIVGNGLVTEHETLAAAEEWVDTGHICLAARFHRIERSAA